MNDEQKRMLVAVVLSAGILFTWQKFYGPEQTQTPVAPETKSTSSQNIDSTNTNTTSPTIVNKKNLKNEQYIEVSNEVANFKVSNYLSIEPNGSKFADLTFEAITGSNHPYSIEFLVGERFQAENFTFNQEGPDSFSGTSPSGISISGKVDKQGNLNLNFKSAQDLKYRFKFISKEKKLENNQVRRYAYYTDELETIDVGDEDRAEAKLHWIGIDFDYHLFAFSFPKNRSFVIEAREDGALLAQRLTSSSEFNITVTFTKKDYDRLGTLGNKLSGSVDFGIWKIIAVPILRGLQFFYGLIPNYGIAIIFLTLVVRLITFPLQFKSFKSMKKMQTIQPELTKLREKFKDDPQRMQKESMELFKRSGANPLGGCLPLLLQMPVFFAFYKVLYSAVELVGAPFILWINDLSVKDPYYVLPVLMAIAMFLQQKLTPAATADPTQKKVMMFMPLIFGLIMKDLPAGLCLYIFVSTLFGMIQQLLVYRTAD